MKNFGETEAWECPIFWVPPSNYLRNGKSYGFQIWPLDSEGPSQQNPIKNFAQNLKFVALPVPEIIGGIRKN